MAAGRSEPPDGTPGGVPDGGDEELRSTVFDESFVRAAQLEEFSARQRLEESTSPVRDRRPARFARTLPRQGVALALTILTALVVAVFLGGNPYNAPGPPEAVAPPHTRVLPLVPEGPVPGGTPEALYADSPAGGYDTGAAGLVLPPPAATASFDRAQVTAALALAKDYAVASGLDPRVLEGTTTLPVRALLGPRQQSQLDAGLAGRAGSPPVTGWLIRFDPGEVVLAEERVRTDGELRVAEARGRLEVTVVQVAAYALRPAGEPDAAASLFVVHRELLLGFAEDDLSRRRVVLVAADVLAGPLDCAADPAGGLRPLLAGESSAAEPGTDPFAWSGDGVRPCTPLAG